MSQLSEQEREALPKWWGPLGRFAMLAAAIVGTAAVAQYRIGALEMRSAEQASENRTLSTTVTDIRLQLAEINASLREINRRQRENFKDGP